MLFKPNQSAAGGGPGSTRQAPPTYALAYHSFCEYRYDNDVLPCSPLFLWRQTGPIEWYVEEHGYAYVHADVRGSGISGGEFGLWGKEEQRDLYDLIEWIAAQSW